ncbi:MAG: nickel pincer cofactor biosynthesis protein LarB [Chloroflexota bacterium]
MREVLRRLEKGKISCDEAEKAIKLLALEEVGTLAKLDIGRDMRRGIPEIVIAEGKTPQGVAEITLAALARQNRAIISRVNQQHVKAVQKALRKDTVCSWNEKAQMLVVKSKGFTTAKTGGKVGILTAGTSDIPVAEEAKVIAEEMGCEVITAYDVGVAGIHRLFKPLKDMLEKDVDAIIVVAGREGALASVVAGLVDVAIIAVPVSSGYGFGGDGVTALMAMLQACPLGLAVVNVDGGVPAGSMAALIANRVAKFRAATKKQKKLSP